MTVKTLVKLFILVGIVYVVGQEAGAGTAAGITMIVLELMHLSHKLDRNSVNSVNIGN